MEQLECPEIEFPIEEEGTLEELKVAAQIANFAGCKSHLATEIVFVDNETKKKLETPVKIKDLEGSKFLVYTQRGVKSFSLSCASVYNPENPLLKAGFSHSKLATIVKPNTRFVYFVDTNFVLDIIRHRGEIDCTPLLAKGDTVFVITETAEAELLHNGVKGNEMRRFKHLNSGISPKRKIEWFHKFIIASKGRKFLQKLQEQADYDNHKNDFLIWAETCILAGYPSAFDIHSALVTSNMVMLDLLNANQGIVAGTLNEFGFNGIVPLVRPGDLN